MLPVRLDTVEHKLNLIMLKPASLCLLNMGAQQSDVKPIRTDWLALRTEAVPDDPLGSHKH